MNDLEQYEQNDFGLTPVMKIPLITDLSKWLIPFVLPRRFSMLSAEPKAGKTWWAESVSLAISDGIAFGGVIPASHSGPVLYFIGEGSDASLKERAVAIRRPKNLPIENFWVARRSFELLLNPDPQRAARGPQLAATIEKYRPALVVIDPARRFFDGDENSSDVVGVVTRYLLELCRYFDGSSGRSDTSILLLHHTGVGTTRARGSGDWDAAPDAILKGSKVAGDPEVETAIHVEGMGRAVAGLTPHLLRVLKEPLSVDLQLDAEEAARLRREWQALDLPPLPRLGLKLGGIERTILELVQNGDHGRGVALSIVREGTQHNGTTVAGAVQVLVDAGLIERTSDGTNTVLRILR